MTARRYTPEQLGDARIIRARHTPAGNERTCAGCGWPYPCPESSRTAFVLADSDRDECCVSRTSDSGTLMHVDGCQVMDDRMMPDEKSEFGKPAATSEAED